MFLQVLMSQLCPAVCIMWPHVPRAAASSAIQLFAQEESDHGSISGGGSSSSMDLGNSQRRRQQVETAMWAGCSHLLPYLRNKSAATKNISLC